MLDAFFLLRNSMHVMRPRLVSFVVAHRTETFILDSGGRRIALLPVHLHERNQKDVGMHASQS